MNLLDLLTALVTDYTLRNVALGSAVLGVVSGVLGCFAVLRRQGLVGDALSHAALPGICLAFMLTGSKAPLVLMLGAALSGWVGMLLILQILRRTRIDQGSALGIVLTVFFGFGVVLLTVIQKGNNANQAGLDKFLFGQAAALVTDQVMTMAVLAALCLGVVTLLFKEFKLISFDPEFAGTQGYNTASLGTLLTGLIVVAIVIGLNTVGVILMSAMLVAPAAARQWTDSLHKMVALAATIGALSGITGAVLSVTQEKVPTGPAIILVLAAVVTLSLLFGTARGIIWKNKTPRGGRGSTEPELTHKTIETPEAKPQPPTPTLSSRPKRRDLIREISKSKGSPPGGRGCTEPEQNDQLSQSPEAETQPPNLSHPDRSGGIFSENFQRLQTKKEAPR